MLGLKLPTDPRWANIASRNIEEILIDHAWCEQKAAASGISLIILYPGYTRLVDVMTEVVAEEWQHFQRVLEELKKRGYSLGPQRRDEYVVLLMALERKGGKQEWRLLDRLLLNALIEARSCERFRLLSLEVSDPELREFYHELMVSEAGHYRVLLDLAREYNPEEVVKKRWNEFLEEEAKIIASLDVRDDRIH
ncbi:MAG: tRNA-(ms[2]io[6]A)-hydroxylase [Bacteroidota bacterium]